MDKIGRCLVVSRHQLLQLQQQDITAVCQDIEIVPELPTEPTALKQFLNVHNPEAVIGTLPINVIQLLQNNNVIYITFNMRSLGTYRTKEEADQVVAQYGVDRVAVLMPSKPNEFYRVTLYQGLKAIKVIVEETPIITHS
ncbi:MAG: hypothetical protein RXR17_09215 [Sulfolobaceae archaeon]